METAVTPISSSASSLGEVYERHARPAKALAYLLTGDHHLAEDLVQEAFVRLAGRLEHLRNRDALGAYLRRTVINLHMSRLRRLRNERRLAKGQSPPLAPNIPFPDLEGQDEVIAALRAIPRRQQVAVVLRYCLDYSEASVAKDMNCSLAAARSLIARGIKSLRDVMGGVEVGPAD